MPGVPDNYPSPFLNKQGQHQYEQFKKNKATLKVRKRVLESYRNGETDIVFRSISHMESTFQKMKNISLNSSVFVEPKSQTCERHALQCEALSSYFLEQEELLRFYALGWISEPNLQELSVLNPELFANQVVKRLEEFGMTCHDADPNGDTPCNIYTSLALKKVYGVDEFYWYRGNKRHYMNANQIYDYLTRGAEGWKLIGEANDQLNLDKAAFYANQGLPVVAVSKGAVHGHIALMMPSLAIETSDLDDWEGFFLPKVTSFFIGRPEKSFYYKKISFAWTSPNGVLFFVKIPEN